MQAKCSETRSISILFVEDDELILGLQSSMLSSKFPDVVIYTAINGRLGLELFKTHSPDIVLTDINMSEMCGVRMSQAIRALKPDTKFIAITGKSENLVQQNSVYEKFVFDHVIVKPVNLAELFATIEKCISSVKY